MRGRKTGLAALALTLGVAAVALVFAAAPWAGSTGGRQATAQLKAAWIYVGPHNDGGWSQAHDKGRLYVRRRSAAKVQDDVQGERPGGPAGLPGDRQPRPRREQDHLRDLVRLPEARWSAAAKKYPDVKFEMATGTYAVEEHGRVLRRGRGRDLPLRDGGGRGDEEGHDRLRRAVRDPRGDPARERVRARRAGDAPGRQGASSSGRTRGSTRRRRRRRPRACTRPAPTCSARTSTARRPASTPSRPASRGSATTRTRASSRRSSG